MQRKWKCTAPGNQVSACKEHVLIARGLINIQALPGVCSHWTRKRGGYMITYNLHVFRTERQRLLRLHGGSASRNPKKWNFSSDILIWFKMIGKLLVKLLINIEILSSWMYSLKSVERWQMIRRNISPPSSGSKNKSSKNLWWKQVARNVNYSTMNIEATCSS